MFITAIAVFATVIFIFFLVVLGSVSIVHGFVNPQLATGARAIWIAVGFVLCLMGYSVIVSPFPLAGA